MTLAYYWGEDAFGLEDAARAMAARLADQSGQPPDVWRTSAEDGATASTIDEISQRIATAPMFGSGTLVVVRGAAGLLREATARERTKALLQAVAPGNALCFLDLLAAGGKGPAAAGALRDAVAAEGGEVKQFPALTRERLEAWLVERARSAGNEFGPGAARLLAERVGGYVREGDVDRRRQSELAAAELDKLALYRPAGPISRDDVAALVPEAVPASAWAMLDAVGYRRAAPAATLVDRLLTDGTPLPVLISQLHRRLRELIIVAEHLAAGSRPADIVREMGLAPFRAQKLSEQARGWTPAALEAALDGLLGLDLLSKGIAPDGGPRSLSDDRSRLALLGWIGSRVARAG